MANYPATLPSTTPADHDAVNNELVAVATELGTEPSGTFTTVRERLDASRLPATIVNRTTAYTAAAGDFVQGDTTTAAFTVTLPSAAYVGALVTVKRVAGANDLTVAPAAGGNIDGDLDATIVANWAGAVFEHVGSEAWRVVAVMTSAGSGEGSYALARQTTVQSIPNATWTALTMADSSDPDGLWTSPTLTFNQAGLWSVSAGVAFAANTTGRRYLRLVQNGTVVPGRMSLEGEPTQIEMSMSRLIRAALNDTLKVEVYQDSGAALDTSISGTPQEHASWLEVAWVRS